MQLTDNLVEAFRYHVKRFDNKSKTGAKENFTNTVRYQQNQIPKVGELISLYANKNISNDITFGEIRKNYAFPIMKEEAIQNTADQMAKKFVSEHSFKWKIIDKMTRELRIHLREIFMELDFESSKSKCSLLVVINTMKKRFFIQK